MNKITLSRERIDELLKILQIRFERHMNRHKQLKWEDVKNRLTANAHKMWSLNEMEETGGEPDVIGYDKKAGEYIFCDCSPESPKNRRSLCYDHDALLSRKEHKPKHSAIELASEMGIELLSEEQYRELQKLGPFDCKTSSWLATPRNVRKLGGAIFGDFRFGQVFIYHNGAESYYASRGFRGIIRI